MESFIKNSFQKYLESLRLIYLLPSFSNNPVKVLYENKARSVLFKLEALSRICRSIYDKKIFKDFASSFKELEDGLGAIEYYDELYSEFSKDKSTLKSFLNYFSNRKSEVENKLKGLIIENKSNNIKFIDSKKVILEKVKWKNSDEERTKFIEFLLEEMDEIVKDLGNGDLNFNDIENGLHEVRRKIRWISIYAVVCDGIIQLKRTSTPNPSLNKYLSKEIINLPYNKFPKPQKGIPPIFIQSQNFYALSWIINELGKLKDEGLKRMEIEEGIKTTTISNKKDLKKKMLKDLLTDEKICDQGENVVDEFVFTNGVMERIRRDLKRTLIIATQF